MNEHESPNQRKWRLVRERQSARAERVAVAAWEDEKREKLARLAAEGARRERNYHEALVSDHNLDPGGDYGDGS